jgi:hypothetical protein
LIKVFDVLLDAFIMNKCSTGQEDDGVWADEDRKT